MTTHSELSDKALLDAGIKPTTTRISVGLEDPRMFVAHMQKAAEFSIEPEKPGFAADFPSADEIDRMYKDTYLDVHRRFISSQHAFSSICR